MRLSEHLADIFYRFPNICLLQIERRKFWSSGQHHPLHARVPVAAGPF
jgi:hypothetical protein